MHGLSSAEDALRAVCGWLCHQAPSRALDLGAAASLLCARCTGVWSGVFLGVTGQGLRARAARGGAGPVGRRGALAAQGLAVLALPLHVALGSPGGAGARLALGLVFGLAVGAALGAWAWPAARDPRGAARWATGRAVLLADCALLLTVLLLDVGRGVVEGLVLAGLATGLHAVWRVIVGRPRGRAGASADRPPALATRSRPPAPRPCGRERTRGRPPALGDRPRVPRTRPDDPAGPPGPGPT